MEPGSKWRMELPSSVFPFWFFSLGFTHLIYLEAKPDNSVWTNSNLDVWTGVKKENVIQDEERKLRVNRK